jgi:regulation of enolase protein 1 (concanavalin A-like superfamily)
VKLDFSTAKWFCQPKRFEITSKTVSITTEPGSDFWQRSYYAFRNDNAHAIQLEISENFTFTARASFDYHNRFDQCGLVIHIDSDNWFKAAIEYEDERISRLGSVVTNLGYSDWATTDIRTPNEIWYRLSRRGPDFLVESSPDGVTFRQMRIFHLHCLGETTAEMGKVDPPIAPAQSIPVGLYACSPLNSSFTACFDSMKIEPCLWMAHH